MDVAFGFLQFAGQTGSVAVFIVGMTLVIFLPTGQLADSFNSFRVAFLAVDVGFALFLAAGQLMDRFLGFCVAFFIVGMAFAFLQLAGQHRFTEAFPGVDMSIALPQLTDQLSFALALLCVDMAFSIFKTLKFTFEDRFAIAFGSMFMIFVFTAANQLINRAQLIAVFAVGVFLFAADIDRSFLLFGVVFAFSGHSFAPDVANIALCGRGAAFGAGFIGCLVTGLSIRRNGRILRAGCATCFHRKHSRAQQAHAHRQ